VRNRIIMAALCAVVAGPSPAQESPRPLTWPEVVDRLDADPVYREARARSEAARAAVDATGQVPNPRWELSAGEGQTADGGQRKVEWSVGLSIPLEWAATRGPKVDAARAASLASEEEARLARQEALLRLRRLFVEVAAEARLAGSLSASSEQADALARLVRRRVESGEARPTELPRIEVEAERARLALSLAEARLAIRRGQLALWLGRPVESVVLDVATAPAPPPLPAVRDRVGAQPKVRAALARLSSAGEEVRAERNQRIPSVSVGGYALSEVDRRAVGGALGLELPIWNWNPGGVARATAVEAAETSRVQALRIEAESALLETWTLCAQAGDAARRLRGQVLPRGELAATKVERAYQLGEASLLEVLDARRAFLETQREALAAEASQQLECGALAILAGGDLR
jgi:outer membrane protein, heavy metal efflux system